MSYKKKPEETKTPPEDDFYLPPNDGQIREMYETYANMKPIKSGAFLVSPEEVFLHSKKVLSWNKDYGFSVYDNGEDSLRDYERAKKDWALYTQYYIKRQIAIEMSTKTIKES